MFTDDILRCPMSKQREQMVCSFCDAAQDEQTRVHQSACSLTRLSGCGANDTQLRRNVVSLKMRRQMWNMCENRPALSWGAWRAGGWGGLAAGHILSEPLAYLEQDDIINNQNC